MRSEKKVIEIVNVNGISADTVLATVSEVLNKYRPMRVNADGSIFRPRGWRFLPVERQVSFILFSKMRDARPTNRLILFAAWHRGNKISLEFVWRQNRRR